MYTYLLHLFVRPENGDPEDLWDFGTVRHGGRNTVGRSMRTSGPPLTWENNGSPQRPDEASLSPSRRVSTSSNSSSVTAKGELPALPSSASQKPLFQQSTVRHMPPGTTEKPQSSPTVSPHSHPQFEDYDDQYVPDTFSSAKSGILHKIQDLQLDDDVPDPAMLDSVILPAIASVSSLRLDCI